MEDFIFQLIAQLDTSKAIKDYNAFKEKLEKEINIKVNLDTSNISNISKLAEQLQSALSKASNGKINIDTGQITSALEQVVKNSQKTGQKVGNALNQGIENGVSKTVGKVNAEIQKITNQANKIQLSIETGGYESKVESLIAKTQQWTDVNGNARISTTALSTALNDLGNASKALSNSNTIENQKALIAAEKELDTQIRIITNSVRSMNSEYMKTSAVDALRNKVQQFYDLNGKSHFKWGSDLKRIMSELGQGIEVPIARGKQLEQQFIQIQNAARQAGKLGKTWFQTLKEGMSSFSYWTSSTFLVMKAIQSVKSGISSVKALDTALVDLKKTTTMTNSELEDFYYSSNKVAKQMGVTTEEIINQASAWSRLGFSSAEAATKMAKLSSQFASISPGMDVDEATTSLVSMMRAYDVEVDDVLDGIMSKINDIGNKFGTSNAEIAEGLRKSSAAMAAVGGSIESNIALFTGAQEIVQDASQVGNAIRSIALRVRSYDEETEEFSEDLANLKGEVIDLTKVASNDFKGISLFTDESQTEYRDMVEYLGDIADIWGELEAKSQNELLNKLFGKNRAQVGAAMIKNFDQIRSALEVMENSAGSADREMSVIMDSLDYKLNRLSETGTSVAQNLFKRDDMKTVIDGLTSVMNVIDSLTSKLGLFGSIGLGAGLFAGFKNVGSPKMFGFNLSENIPTVC